MRIRFSRSLVMSVMLVALALVLVSVPDAEAQDSHWGVTASFVPSWKAIPKLEELDPWESPDFAPAGSEFRIGLVRGSDHGGDWSVMFIRNTIRAEGTDDIFVEDDRYDPPLLYGTSLIVPKAPVINGIKYEKFTPVITIQDRVQIGLTYGGGIGALQGDVTETILESDYGTQPPTQTETVNHREVKELYGLSFVPIGSVEAAVAVILAPGLKARITGGFNFPNTQMFSVTVNYLFGGR